jgi:hypothetical protein
MDIAGLFPWRQSDRSVKLNTHLHLVPKSIMREAIPPLPQYVFMAWFLVKHRDNFTFLTFYPVLYSLTLFLTEHHAMEVYGGNGNVAPRIL